MESTAGWKEAHQRSQLFIPHQLLDFPLIIHPTPGTYFPRYNRYEPDLRHVRAF